MSDRVTDIKSRARLGTTPKPTGNLMRKRQLQSRLQEENDALRAGIQQFGDANAQLRGILAAVVYTYGELALSIELLNTRCMDAHPILEGKGQFVVVRMPPETLTVASVPDETIGTSERTDQPTMQGSDQSATAPSVETPTAS